MVVHPNRAKLQLGGETHRPSNVFREDRRGKPVQYVVAHLKRLLLVVKLLHGNDGTEDLALHDLPILLNVRDNRRRVVIALLQIFRDFAPQ